MKSKLLRRFRKRTRKKVYIKLETRYDNVQYWVLVKPLDLIYVNYEDRTKLETLYKEAFRECIINQLYNHKLYYKKHILPTINKVYQLKDKTYENK